MIIFKTIRWKNLLSTGNVFTEIKLNQNANALIIGENGAGKSTILDALCFSLFGKAFRKINKPGLVNSVNEKNCVVEIEFSTNGKDYKVIRGIKPTIFEIYVDGTMLNQDSASKDYQEYLEKFILKMNYKSFTQIVILGSASFTPFMQLSPADRRTVIEDLLDIQIFSTMNVIAKQKMQANKDALERNRIELAGKEEKKSFIEKTLASLKSNNEERLKELERQHGELAQQKKDLLDKVQLIADEKNKLVDEVSNITELRQTYEKAIKQIAEWDSNAKRLNKEKEFLKNSDECPTCKQHIDETFRDKRVLDLGNEISTICTHSTGMEATTNNIIAEINEKEEKSKRIQSINAEIKSSKQTMMHIVSSMNDLEDSIDKIKNADKLTLDNKNELIEVDEAIIDLMSGRETLLNDRQYIETALVLLKDGGIKTKIVKQYLPIINKLINKYLAQMGFFVNFNINENFEETIKSRYRDEFSYQNFSEGEKMRIDLALLFTWRSIAKMRNSVNTNLLMLDEVFDGSLDANGTDEFLKIMLYMLSDTNTFVISHKTDQLIDKFEKVYRFEKHKNFSRLTA